MLPSELLAKPESWCQQSLGRDKDGMTVGCLSTDAVSWCIEGALLRCFNIGRDYEEANLKLLETFKKLHRCYNYTSWNDDKYRTHDEVLALLKEAGL